MLTATERKTLFDYHQPIQPTIAPLRKPVDLTTATVRDLISSGAVSLQPVLNGLEIRSLPRISLFRTRLLKT